MKADLFSELFEATIYGKNDGFILCEDREGKNINRAERVVKNEFSNILGKMVPNPHYDENDPNSQKEIEMTPRLAVTFVRNDMPNSRLCDCKFLAGCTRIYFSEMNNGETGQRTISKINKILPFIASKEHVEEYTNELDYIKDGAVEKMTADELIDRFGEARNADIQKQRETLAKKTFTRNPEYKIVRIPSFAAARKYGQYTTWCVTQSSGLSNYNAYTENGNCLFYFCLKNGFEQTPKVLGENAPLDEYGLSMIAVLVNTDGSLKHCTCRWNHANGGNDNIMDAEQVSDILGVNFYSVFKPKPPEEVMKGIIRKEQNAALGKGPIKGSLVVGFETNDYSFESSLAQFKKFITVINQSGFHAIVCNNAESKKGPFACIDSIARIENGELEKYQLISYKSVAGFDFYFTNGAKVFVYDSYGNGRIAEQTNDFRSEFEQHEIATDMTAKQWEMFLKIGRLSEEAFTESGNGLHIDCKNGKIKKEILDLIFEDGVERNINIYNVAGLVSIPEGAKARIFELATTKEATLSIKSFVASGMHLWGNTKAKSLNVDFGNTVIKENGYGESMARLNNCSIRSGKITLSPSDIGGGGINGLNGAKLTIFNSVIGNLTANMSVPGRSEGDISMTLTEIQGKFVIESASGEGFNKIDLMCKESSGTIQLLSPNIHVCEYSDEKIKFQYPDAPMFGVMFEVGEPSLDSPTRIRIPKARKASIYPSSGMHSSSIAVKSVNMREQGKSLVFGLELSFGDCVYDSLTIDPGIIRDLADDFVLCGGHGELFIRTVTPVKVKSLLSVLGDDFPAHSMEEAFDKMWSASHLESDKFKSIPYETRVNLIKGLLQNFVFVSNAEGTK